MMGSEADKCPQWLAEVGKEWTVFLDRDGVVNRRLVGDYVKSWTEWNWLPGSLEAIVQLSHEVKHVFVVTNQQGVAKGLMTEEDLGRIHANMLAEVEKAGGRIDAVFHCPHFKSAECECRKPEPGMFFQALERFPDIDNNLAVMVGDSTSDMEWAHRAGVHAVAVGEEAVGGEFRVESLEKFVKMMNEVKAP